MDTVSIVISSLAALPLTGKIIAGALALVPVLGAVISALVVLWHSVVVCAKALSFVPGLGWLSSLADKWKVVDDKIQDVENSKILPLLNRLSAIPLPQKQAGK